MLIRRLSALLAGRLHYGWIVVAIAFLVMLATAGVRSAPSVLIVPLEKAFGWDRSTISAAISLNIFLFGIIGPFATALMQTLGLKRTILLALTLLGTSVTLSGFITAPWMLFATWGVLVGLSAGATSTGLAATVANRWFVRRRGLVVGLLMASGATGQLVFLPLLAALASSGSWRLVSWVVAAVAIALIPIVLILLPERPASVGLRAFGAIEDDVIERRTNPLTTAFAGLARGAKSFDFWLLASSFFVCGFSTNGLVGTHLISYCMDHGIAEVTAAGLIASMGLFDLVGTTASGWLTDRYNPRVLLFVYYGLRGLSLMVLPFTDFDVVSLSIFAVFYGLDWIATIPPTVMLVTRHFGRADGPVIVSWIVVGHQIGAAVAAVGAGTVRSLTGSYAGAFLASGVACVIAALLVLRVRQPAPAVVAAPA
jgi:sugar phosphate permease